MKKILVIVLSNLKHDARVRRQISALQDNYKVTVVCFGADNHSEFEVVVIKPTKLTLLRKALASIFLLLRFYSIAHKILHDYFFVIELLKDQKFDLIIANDVETLPLAFAFHYNPKVIFDAHEYAPRHFEDKRMWRLFFQKFNLWLCEKYIPKAAAMLTVGRGLANEYEKNFHIKPTVITNANNYYEVEPGIVPENQIHMVHHGIATPSRKLELMIDVMALLEKRFTLDLILLTPGFASKKTRQYIDDLRTRAESDPRIKIIPPVKSSEVVAAIRNYDIGIFLLPPVNFNYENTLPNKLFDFIQARLGVAIGPTPEMAEIVRHYNIGVVADDFTAESLAKKLNQLTKADTEHFKKNASKAARELNAETNAVKLNKLISGILN
jgi:glycosyltransferase involved in cell wall biosynthesis